MTRTLRRTALVAAARSHVTLTAVPADAAPTWLPITPDRPAVANDLLITVAIDPTATPWPSGGART